MRVDLSMAGEDAMNKKNWLVVMLVFIFAAANISYAITDYPDEVKKKIKSMKEDAHAKKEMPEAFPGIQTISGEEAVKMLKAKKAVAIDCRVKTQYDTEKIPRAESLLPEELIDNPLLADKFDKNKEYVVYCSSVTCWRSPATALMLQFLGFKNIYWYRDGLRDWKDKGFPTD